MMLLSNDTMILLSNDTNNEEKYRAANNIIITHDLPLSADQVLLACKKILDWFNNIKDGYWVDALKNRIFLLNETLHINKNMYIAMILALHQNYDPTNLRHFIKFDGVTPVDVGTNTNHNNKTILADYCELLDYYDFDVDNIPAISSVNKEIIQAYRDEKYFGKLTKRAIKIE